MGSNVFESIVIVWLLLLSIACVALAMLVRVKWRSLHERMASLDLSERLSVVCGRLDAETVRRNAQLANAVDDAIQVFEDNKVLLDRHWRDYQHLKALRP